MENNLTTDRKNEKKITYNTIESTLGVTGKLTPQAVEFEEAVLGAMMIDVNATGETIDILDAKMFYKEAHQHIFAAIKKLFEKNYPIDLLTVTNQLRQEKKLEFVGGPSYLAFLTNRVASSANIEYHARVVIEKFVLRELITNCNDTIKKAYDESKDVLELLDEAETNMFSIVQNNFKRDSKELGSVVENAIRELEEMKKQNEQYTGVPTGLYALDSKIGGWQKSDLIIIAARPGMGKTSLVLTIARNAAIDYGKTVALFSLEMSATQLVHRLFSLESGIDSEKISRGKLSDDEWINLMDKIRAIENNNKLIIDDTPGLSVFDLRAKCRRLQKKYGLELIIVDYLQLMQGQREGEKTKGNREQEISYISRSLKSLAKELNVPVIALSQLSRNVETRNSGSNSRRPELSDLRESGSIEQDADMVMFIYRPEYYKFNEFEDGSPAKGFADLMIKKNRHGAVDDVRVRFISQYTKFTDVDAVLNIDNSDANQPFNPSAGITDNTSFDNQGNAYATISSSMNSDAESAFDGYFGNNPEDGNSGLGDNNLPY